MNLSIFRAYSIRGVAGESLTVGDMRLIGQATGTVLIEKGLLTAVLGRDYRLSSPELSAALADGLLSTGLNGIDIGPCPTPLLNFATDHYGAGAGLMVTASHNPPQDNGLKIRTDHSLGGDELRHIYEVVNGGVFCRGQGMLSCADPTGDYLEAICRRVEVSRPLRAVVDAGNGAAGPLVPRLVERLGCRAVPLYCEPDGHFSNRDPDPKAARALDALAARVLSEQADAGLAYDGDADRLAMVDETGEIVLGDRLLALLAVDALARHPGGKVVYELSCTQALAEAVTTAGGQPIPCPVGYAFVHETMRQTGAIMGGETAGHLFFAEPGFQFDDAMLATAKMLSLLSRSERSFSRLIQALPHYYASPEHRFGCPEGQKQAVVAYVREECAAQGYDIEQMDGVRVHFGDGWGLFRSSNTQPAVALRCEARTHARLAEIERGMLDVVQRALHALVPH